MTVARAMPADKQRADEQAEAARISVGCGGHEGVAKVSYHLAM